MDQDVINLAKAIRQKESGGNFSAVGDAGTSKGGYQWQPETWKANAKAILGDENAPMTPDHQNAVAYGVILKDKQAGLNPAQIAAKWNSGRTQGWENMRGEKVINGQKIRYDVPAYVKEVTDIYHSLKTPTANASGGPSDEPVDYYANPENQPTPGVWFKSKADDTPLVAGAKTLGNVLPSAFNFGKNIIKSLNPIEIVKNIQQIPKEFKALSEESGGAFNALKATAKELPGTAYETIVPEAARDVIKGDFAGAAKKVTEDPFGQVAPFVLAGRGLAGKADAVASRAKMGNYVENIAENYKNPIPAPVTKYGDAFDNVMKKTTDTVTAPIKTVFGKAGEGVGSATKFGIGQATGLSPETINQVVENPSAFSKTAMKTAGDRATLGQEIQSSLQKRAATLEETGKAYEPVRNSGTPVKVDKGFLQNIVKETTGVDIKNGKVATSGKATIRDATEVRALQNLVDLWDPVFKKGEMTPTEFLNFRSDLAKLSKFERQIGVSRPLENVAKIMRGRVNEAYRPQLKGLDALDESFSSQRAELNTLSKNLVDRNGNLTDAAVNKIANATGKGKDALLARLEEIAPGITQKIRVLKAVEDIQNASGIKVGAYTRTALVGGGLVMGGPIMAAVNAILTSPQLAVPILRQYGLLKNSAAIKTIINALKEGGQIINNPAQISPYLNKNIEDVKVPMGLSIEDVSKKPGYIPPTKTTILQKGGRGMEANYGSDLGPEMVLLKEPVTVFRGEGGGIGNSTLVKGRYFADSEEFAKNFGEVKKTEIPKNTAVLDLDNLKTGDGAIPQKLLVDQEALTNYLLDRGIKWTKNTNSRGVEYVELKRSPEYVLAKEASKHSNFIDFVTKAGKSKEFSEALDRYMSRGIADVGSAHDARFDHLKELFNENKKPSAFSPKVRK